jgi:hypothetical protein
MPMIKSTGIRVLAALLLVSCQTTIAPQRTPTLSPPAHIPSMPEPYRPSTFVPGVTPRQIVGIVVETRESVNDVRPYRVRADRGDRVEWYSVSGRLQIEWRDPSPRTNPPLPRVNCNSDQRVCWVDIPRDQPNGDYPYHAHVETVQGRVTFNQPEVEIPKSY